MFGDSRTATHLGRVAKSIRRAYAQGWRIGVSWRIMKRNGNRLGIEMDEWGLENDVTEMVAYFCAERKNTEATVSRKVTATIVYHEQ